MKMIADGRFQFQGQLVEDANWLVRRHLKNEKMWKLFVEQFRLHSDSPSEENGWINGWRGEYWGKSMRGAIAVYSYMRDEELYKVLTETVEDMLTTQDELGRFSTYAIDSEFGNWDIWCRKYVLLGMQHYYEICKDENLKQRILEALCKHLDYLMSKVGPGEGKEQSRLPVWRN